MLDLNSRVIVDLVLDLGWTVSPLRTEMFDSMVNHFGKPSVFEIAVYKSKVR